MLIRLLPFAVLATVFTAATCVKSFEAQGPSGPWTGEFQHLGSYNANNFEWQAKIVDANGADAPAITMNICPHSVPAGGTGAFEMAITPPQRGSFTADPPAIQGYGGLDLSHAQQGLVATITAVASGSATATIRNQTDNLISDIIVCGIARDAAGKVISVSTKETLKDHLLPGASADVEMSFTRRVGVPALITAHATGVPVTLQEQIADGSIVVDTGPFDVTLPRGWTYAPRQGIDSFVGEFAKDGVGIFFDYGWYSGGLSDYEDDPDFAASHETIDGRAAVVVSPVGATSGVTAAHIIVSDADPSMGVRTTILLFGEDVPQTLRAEALSIYRSLKFEDE